MNPCPIGDCVREAGHAIHEDASGALWHEPVLSPATAQALVHADIYTYGELRAGRSSRVALELEACGCARAVMGNRVGVYQLTPLGHAVAVLTARRRVAAAQARLGRQAAEAAAQAPQRETL